MTINFKEWLNKNESLANLASNLVSMHTGLPGFDELGMQSSIDAATNAAKLAPQYISGAYNTAQETLQKTLVPIDQATYLDLLKKCQDETSKERSAACAKLCMAGYTKGYSCQIGNCKPTPTKDYRGRKSTSWKCSPQNP